MSLNNSRNLSAVKYFFQTFNDKIAIGITHTIYIIIFLYLHVIKLLTYGTYHDIPSSKVSWKSLKCLNYKNGEMLN